MSFMSGRNSGKVKTVGKELDVLRSDLRQVRGDLKRVLQAVGKGARGSARESGQRWWDGARDLEERFEEGIHDTYADVRDHTYEAVDRAREELGKRPFLMVFFAVGIGLLLNELLRRPRR